MQSRIRQSGLNVSVFILLSLYDVNPTITPFLVSILKKIHKISRICCENESNTVVDSPNLICLTRDYLHFKYISEKMNYGKTLGEWVQTKYKDRCKLVFLVKLSMQRNLTVQKISIIYYLDLAPFSKIY